MAEIQKEVTWESNPVEVYSYLQAVLENDREKWHLNNLVDRSKELLTEALNTNNSEFFKRAKTPTLSHFFKDETGEFTFSSRGASWSLEIKLAESLTKLFNFPNGFSKFEFINKIAYERAKFELGYYESGEFDEGETEKYSESTPELVPEI
jgi:hypothetical protein